MIRRNALDLTAALSLRSSRQPWTCTILTFLAAIVVFALLPVIASAQTFSVLYAFKYGTDGGNVAAGLIEDATGNLYGVAEVGGNLNCKYGSTGYLGCGVVFKVTQTGKETVLYNFLGGTDGAGPAGTLIRDAQGNFYGTTLAGGDATCTLGNGDGCGTIFKLNASGKEIVLYRFHGNSDGAAPGAGLYLDKEGNLWGTTQRGGLNPSSCLPSGCGTLFKLNPQGRLYTHLFKGQPSEGSWPLGALIADTTGNLYGTTQFGGANGGGILYKVTPAGALKTFYTFGSGADASQPTGLLLANSKLYGPAVSGGAYGGGSVFSFNAGQDALLYNFSQLNDEANVFASGVLARDPEGNLYGTTQFDGGFGSVYELTADGTYLTLYYFEGAGDGENPAAGVIRDSSGNLFGTTEYQSTVFKVTP